MVLCKTDISTSEISTSDIIFSKWFPSVQSGEGAIVNFEVLSTTKFIAYSNHSHGEHFDK